MNLTGFGGHLGCLGSFGKIYKKIHVKSPCFCYLQFWAKFLTGNGQNGLVRPKYFEKLQIHQKKPFFSKNRPLAGSDRSFLTSELKTAASVTRPPHTPNFLGLVGFQTFGSNRFLVKKLPQTSRSRLELAFSAIFCYFPTVFLGFLAI